MAQADLIPLSFAIYNNSEQTIGFGMVYDFTILRTGFEVTQFGDDANTLSAASKALNAAAPGTVKELDITYGVGVGFDVGSVPTRIVFEAYEDKGVKSGDTVKLEADLTENMTIVYDSNSSQLNVDLSVSF